MTTLQSILVIVISISFALYIIYSARKARLDMKHAIAWLFIAFAAVIVAVVPRGVMWIANRLDFEASTNLLFIIAILVLAIIAFRQTTMISKMEKQIVRLTQTLAIVQKQGEDDAE